MRYDNHKTFDENYPKISIAIAIVGVLAVLIVVFAAVLGV